MKKSKVIILLFLGFCAMVIGVVSVFSQDPPSGTIMISDFSQYLQFDNYVADNFKKYSSGSFPDASVVNEADGKLEYAYRYECSLLGDPNYYVYTHCVYEETVANKEITRLSETAEHIEKKHDGLCVYVFSGEDSDVSRYFDDEIFDGMRFVFEIVIVDVDERSFRYLFCVVSDNGTRYAHVTEMLDLLK